MSTYLIDASIYIFRAYFSYPNHWYSPQGYELNAVYGYARFIDKLFRDKAPQYCAAAYDESLGSCFRNELYPDYKSSRVLPDESLAFQLEACKQLGELAGIRSFAHDRYEADDLIASLANLVMDDVVVVSRDKDLGQLVRQDKLIWWDPADDKTITANDFVVHFGVLPAQLVDLLALTGDKIDDVPGIPGIGAKTAAALLQVYSSVEQLFASLDSLHGLSIRGAKTLAKKIQPWQDQVLLAKQLVSLERNLPLINSKEELRVANLDSHVLHEFLLALGMPKKSVQPLFQY